MITPKDLRDIAAYWGCKMALADKADSEPRPLLTLNEFSLQTMLGGEWDSIKLHLRPILSLVDEELAAIARILDCEDVWLGELSTMRRSEQINYRPSRLYNGFNGPYATDGLCIHSNGSMNLEGTANGGGSIDIQPQNLPAAYAYLQSIGIYVPGTIDPKYVELI